MYVFEKKIVLTFYIQILTTTGFEKITVLTLNPPILLTNVLSSNNHYCLSRRASSASAKATALAAAVTTLSNATGKMLNDPDVIVSYSAFQAEAAINRLIPIDSILEFPNQRISSLRIDNLETPLLKLKF
jgi:hypothetical protein